MDCVKWSMPIAIPIATPSVENPAIAVAG